MLLQLTYHMQGRHVHTRKQSSELPSHRLVDKSAAALAMTFKWLESHDDSCLLHLTKANAQVTFQSVARIRDTKCPIISLIIGGLTS